MLSVDIRWTEAQAATMTIYDISGRKYADYTSPAVASYHGYIPTDDLPAGVYTLSVRGTTSSIVRQFTVVR